MKTKIILGILIALLVLGSYYFTYTVSQTEKKQEADISEKLTAMSTQQKDQDTQIQALKVSGSNLLPQLQALNLSLFQSVELSDGRVYYGKIARFTPQTLTLTNVYYLQNYADASNPLIQAAPQIALIKSGSEVDAGQDAMVINTANIIFVQTLKSDSRVMQAIEAYQAKN